MLPLCASMIEAAMDSPRPKLPACRDRDLSARTNRSNKCGSSSGAIPGPSSVTVNSAYGSAIVSSARRDTRRHRRALRRMHSCVRQQIGERLMKPCPVTAHPHRPVGHVRQPPVRWRRHRGVVDRVHHQVGEVHLGGVQVLPLVEPRQQQAGRRPTNSSVALRLRCGPASTRWCREAPRCPGASTRRTRESPPAGCAAHGWRR